MQLACLAFGTAVRYAGFPRVARKTRIRKMVKYHSNLALVLCSAAGAYTTHIGTVSIAFIK
jgi:hypothetical protein